MESTLSEQKVITAGVPQGSHLGPVLFILFINDLVEAINCPTEIFADDTLIRVRSAVSDAKSLQSHEEKPQSAVNEAENWAYSWQGKFGSDKPKMLTVCWKGTTVSPIVVLEGKTVVQIYSLCHLGLAILSKLKCSDHITNIVRPASQRAGLLRRMANELSVALATKLYLY